MNRIFSTLGVSLWIALLSPMVQAANLKALDVAALPGDRVELKLVVRPTAPDAPWLHDGLSRPDCPGSARCGQSAGEQDSRPGQWQCPQRDRGGGQGSYAADHQPDPVEPRTTCRVEGNNLFVVVGQGGKPSRQERPLPSPVPVPAPRRVAPTGKAIRGVDFQRGTQGEGNVVIDLSDPSIAPDIQEREGKIVLGFARTRLPEPLRVRLDVKDFATPVQFVNASATGDKATITIEPSGAFDYSTYQTDNKLTVSIRPMTVDDLQKRNADRNAYSGEKLSLNFQDIDVRSVLQLIADFTNLNLVASDTVQGRHYPAPAKCALGPGAGPGAENQGAGQAQGR